ncbi:hypothetical protein L0128_11610 [candidate division KSB1 bacterium]|nr:hypothetical protein [candidate division KSB1 bacterium]
MKNTDSKSHILFLISICCVLLNCQPVSQLPDDNLSINFTHLKHLTETVQLDGKTCDIVHIYSEYPDYQRVDANAEGIACVDDAARAAVVYLRDFELTRDTTVLAPAKRLLNFIRFMQAGDGTFYNFIDKNLKINKTGRTSQKSFTFWAARGYWALGCGYQTYQKIDADFAQVLKNAFLKCLFPLDSLLQNYHTFKFMHARRYPCWLINETGADATAELLLGMTAFLKADTSTLLTDYANKLAEGIFLMQQPFGSRNAGAFLSWEDLWHAWGNSQSQALAELGRLLKRQEYMDAAQREADHYYTLLLTHGLKNSWSASDPFATREFPQIAYDIRCISVGLVKVYQATGDEKYAKLAGLAASWLLGNNVARTTMYDSTSGRSFDGINDSTSVNFNAGAESTIEALYTLIEIQYQPLARPFVFYQCYRHGQRWDQRYQTTTEYRIFSGPATQKMVLFLNPKLPKFGLSQAADVVEEFLKAHD